jgi:hypothetical protein
MRLMHYSYQIQVENLVCKDSKNPLYTQILVKLLQISCKYQKKSVPLQADYVY